MIADKRFTNQPLEFWANVKLISQKLGYIDKIVKGAEKGSQAVKVPTIEQISALYDFLGLKLSKIVNDGQPTDFGSLLISYFEHRANCLNSEVKNNLMRLDDAKELYAKLNDELKPKCPVPLNKQTGDKSGPAYFTALINILLEQSCGKYEVNYDPREIPAFSEEGFPVRSLSRRVDGSFPGVINPIAIWEIKEYYYTTTFGSRIADAVYETMLDGFELAEARTYLKRVIHHYLMVDDYNTWWIMGRPYLCRICDMLHMGLLTEVVFGKEVVVRIPQLVEKWIIEYDKLKEVQ